MHLVNGKIFQSVIKITFPLYVEKENKKLYFIEKEEDTKSNDITNVDEYGYKGVLYDSINALKSDWMVNCQIENKIS